MQVCCGCLFCYCGLFNYLRYEKAGKKMTKMKEMKIYWCEGKPTLENIEQAYQDVNNGYVVQIKWFIPFSGHYDRIITEEVTKKYPDYNDYFNELIPKCYPV